MRIDIKVDDLHVSVETDYATSDREKLFQCLFREAKREINMLFSLAQQKRKEMLSERN